MAKMKVTLHFRGRTKVLPDQQDEFHERRRTMLADGTSMVNEIFHWSQPVDGPRIRDLRDGFAKWGYAMHITVLSDTGDPTHQKVAADDMLSGAWLLLSDTASRPVGLKLKLPMFVGHSEGLGSLEMLDGPNESANALFTRALGVLKDLFGEVTIA